MNFTSFTSKTGLIQRNDIAMNFTNETSAIHRNDVAMNFSHQIVSKPYTVWNLTPKGWIIIAPHDINEKYKLRSVQIIKLGSDGKPLNLISSK